MIPELQTGRLILRPLQLEDAAQVEPLFAQWEIVQHLNNQVPWPFPPGTASKHYRESVLPAIARGEQWNWTLRLKTSPDQIIGAISLSIGDNNRGFTATWPARDDRRTALVWLALFWIYVGVGFGFDLHNYFHEHPPVPRIVHVHAIATTLWLLTATTLVLLVETGNVRLHRTLGWFAAGYAALTLVIAPWSELSWQALNLKTPGALPPEFLSIAFSGVICTALLLPWGVLMRRNSAAHRRVLILATICISDAGFSRMVSLFLPAPTSFFGTYLFYEGGNVLLILLMFLWDWKRNRIMQQFLLAAGLIFAVGLTATGLYFNSTWQAISRSWLEGWARHML